MALAPLMGNWRGGPIGIRLRDAVTVLTLVSHLLVTLGFPLPVSRRQTGSDQAYPCQNRPCGCITAERCWAGDCCCFTIEQKLDWADVNGVTPPGHVRPLVESRRTAGKRSCCPAEPAVCDNPVDADCPHRAAKKDCCEKAAPATTVHWVVGVFAQRCRGEGPAGLLQSEPAIVPPELRPVQAPDPQRDAHLPPQSERLASLTHRPPARPPRA